MTRDPLPCKGQKKTDVTLGVDGNWVLHRAVSTQGNRENPGEAVRKTFVSMVCKDALRVKASRILIGFDGARIFRHKIYSGYKANRSGSPDGMSPYDYLEGLCEYLEYLGLPYLQNHKYEADDVMCSLVAQTPGKTVVATKDKDAYQFMRDDTRLLDSSAKPEPAITSYTDVERKFGLRPELCVDLQTLTGDKIDNIPQLYQRAKAIRGLKTYGSISKWAAEDKEFLAFAKANKDALVLNRKLVRLVPSLVLPDTSIAWNRTAEQSTVPLSYIGLRDFCNPRSKGLF